MKSTQPATPRFDNGIVPLRPVDERPLVVVAGESLKTVGGDQSFRQEFGSQVELPFTVARYSGCDSYSASVASGRFGMYLNGDPTLRFFHAPGGWRVTSDICPGYTSGSRNIGVGYSGVGWDEIAIDQLVSGKLAVKDLLNPVSEAEKHGLLAMEGSHAFNVWGLETYLVMPRGTSVSLQDFNGARLMAGMTESLRGMSHSEDYVYLDSCFSSDFVTDYIKGVLEPMVPVEKLEVADWDHRGDFSLRVFKDGPDMPTVNEVTMRSAATAFLPMSDEPVVIVNVEDLIRGNHGCCRSRATLLIGSGEERLSRIPEGHAAVILPGTHKVRIGGRSRALVIGDAMFLNDIR